MALTPDQKTFWEENGYLVLPKFYSEAEVATVNRVYQKAWEDCPSSIVVDELESGRRCRMSQLSEKEKLRPFFKVNDLYLESEEIRQITLRKDLVPILNELLLGEVPVLCNTLSMLRGSQQTCHVDAIYMTPETPGHLAATWMALEDVKDSAGPLMYYPGSHKIPPYKFSNGSYHAVDAEMDQWRAYYEDEVKKRGLRLTQFMARKGDLLIWSAYLFHGGAPVKNVVQTRNSLVSHFYTLSDMKRRKETLAETNGAYWVVRGPQPVPEEQHVPFGRRVRGIVKQVVPKGLRPKLKRLFADPRTSV